jgi:succinate-acetate transporter protein
MTRPVTMLDVTRKATAAALGLTGVAVIIYAMVVFYPEIHTDHFGMLEVVSYGLYWGLLMLAVAWYKGLRFIYERVVKRRMHDAVHSV